MDARAQLERVTADVIAVLKGIPEFSEARVAVIGGLALWKYIQEGRDTQDVDFIITVDSAPQTVKSKLLALPDSPFLQQAQYFYYKDAQGNYIQIDITPAWQSPYLPTAAKKLKNIPVGSVPYISPTDLLIFKINSCGLRAQAVKKATDAGDAEDLLSSMHCPPSLTANQRSVAETGLGDVVMHGSMTEDWWRQKLGLPAASGA